MLLHDVSTLISKQDLNNMHYGIIVYKIYLRTDFLDDFNNQIISSIFKQDEYHDLGYL